MIKKTKNILLSCIENNNMFILSIFSIVFFPEFILWIFKILMFLDIYQNPHGVSTWSLDFTAYYDAATLYLDGQNIYSSNVGFTYLPISIFLFLPFAYLSFGNAFILFFSLNLFLLFLTTIILSRILAEYKVYISIYEKVLIYAALFMFYPISISFTHGQINIFILFILTMVYYYIFIRKNITISSLLLTLGTIIKIFPIFVVLVGFLNKEYRTLVARYISIMVITLTLSISIFKSKLHLDYINNFVKFQKINVYEANAVLIPNNVLDTNVSITNAIFKFISLFSPSDTFYFALDILLPFVKISFAMIFLFYLYKLSQNTTVRGLPEWEVLSFSSLLIVPLIISNITWIYYGTFLTTSYVLFLFVLKLNLTQKLLFLLVILLHSIQQFVVVLGNYAGGSIASIIYIANPTTYSYILFLFLILYSLNQMDNNFNKNG